MTPETREKLINSLKDIHGYMGITVPDWFIFTVLSIFFFLAVYFIYKFFSKKKSIAEKPFYESLIEKLQKLEFESNNKKFYLKYSELIRLYFNTHIDCSLLDKTTDEIKKELYKITELSHSDAKFLIESFHRADLAKFAKGEFSAEQKLNDLRKAIQILNRVSK